MLNNPGKMGILDVIPYWFHLKMLNGVALRGSRHKNALIPGAYAPGYFDCVLVLIGCKLFCKKSFR